MCGRKMHWGILGIGMALIGTGCMPKFTVEQLSEMRPERPAEMDKLNAFAGKWEMEGQAKMSVVDEMLKIGGTADAKWEGDGWYLVNNAVMNMEGMGEMKAVETWTYDAHSKKYRSIWVDNMGSVGTGEGRHDEKTDTWYFTASSHGPMGKVSMKGTAKVIDENTMEWTWTEDGCMGLCKTMEMTGTSRRR